ncbi:transcriptional regulator, putative [Heliomicrobium modesticaldum Ice1]|uniref:Stage 0 sporulation protein A homolog n=1 Tax=Heliobacterium modesticaldum (strain ATCC 51547 / Ice1) TaxID=498761 RepID=B0TF57_HELMI|nr:response regulator transcription factor [Heliomicrobium modesticaldum]ABZ84374.1 transcriptional regulator, putative [Heliomicrobium modesticaldum Ice1]
MTRIFIADDEPPILELIRRYLEKEGFEAVTFTNGDDLLAAYAQQVPDLVILDIMMPGTNGLDVCKRLRRDSDVPIIIVSAKDDEIDRILGLELGGDDYLSKPFSPRELVVRVKNILRRVWHTRAGNSADGGRHRGNEPTARSSPVVSDALQSAIGSSEAAQAATGTPTTVAPGFACHDLRIDLDERRITGPNGEIDLTAKEFDLLSFLAKHKKKVFTREQLLDQIWGYHFAGNLRSVDDLVKRLRKKLAQSGSTLEIKTVWGYGYKIDVFSAGQGKG